MDELDKILSSVLKKDVELPKNYHNNIQNVLYRKKRVLEKNSIIKVILAISSSTILTTGVVFATNIPKHIIQFFNNNKGMDLAIENDYILNTNMEYSNSDNLQVKIDNILMDDYNLSLTFSIKSNKDISVNDIEKINFKDMIIVDENKRILYCENEDKFNDYCIKNNLNYKYLDFNENYMNNSSNWYVKTKDNETLSLVYNFYSNKYPKSKLLYVNINKIEFIKNNSISTLNGNWDMSIDIPEKFYNRKAYIYTVKDCNDSNIDIKEFAIYNTCTKFEFDTKLQPVFNELDSEETKTNKKEKFAEWAMNIPYNFIENEYIESETGEKYYPVQSNSEDSGTSYPYNGEMNHFQTFNLTQYDNLTNNLKLYFTLHTQTETKNIIIKLERK